MRFDGYMIQPDGTIAFATTHFTVRPDKAVREFLSFRVHPNGRIEARTMILDAVNDAVLKDTAFDCEIGKRRDIPLVMRGRYADWSTRLPGCWPFFSSSFSMASRIFLLHRRFLVRGHVGEVGLVLLKIHALQNGSPHTVEGIIFAYFRNSCTTLLSPDAPSSLACEGPPLSVTDGFDAPVAEPAFAGW